MAILAAEPAEIVIEPDPLRPGQGLVDRQPGSGWLSPNGPLTSIVNRVSTNVPSRGGSVSRRRG